MGRKLGPKCKICRREGEPLHLKGSRCDSPNCAFKRGRDYPPGMHTWRRGKTSEYGRQLRETQKLKRTYGVLERQFRIYVGRAERQRGNTGENLLVLIERRFDNVVYHLGFAQSRSQARQLIVHGHLTFNEHKLDIPSALMSTGNIIGVKDTEKSRKLIKDNLEFARARKLPEWLEREDDALQGCVKMLPSRDQIVTPIQEQLVVEFCSK
ncbi:MAG: 30S ribosomal protein S4 [Planctomycetota bacterium]|nr:MAG: 30S ribosomal protein S4 [Planctomycetota bacterium]